MQSTKLPPWKSYMAAVTLKIDLGHQNWHEIVKSNGGHLCTTFERSHIVSEKVIVEAFAGPKLPPLNMCESNTNHFGHNLDHVCNRTKFKADLLSLGSTAVHLAVRADKHLSLHRLAFSCESKMYTGTVVGLGSTAPHLPMLLALGLCKCTIHMYSISKINRLQSRQTMEFSLSWNRKNHQMLCNVLHEFSQLNSTQPQESHAVYQYHANI